MVCIQKKILRGKGKPITNGSTHLLDLGYTVAISNCKLEDLWIREHVKGGKNQG